LPKVTFTRETAAGWPQANLATPVPITANTVCVVSCHSDGGFSVDENYFSSAVDNPPLHAQLTAHRAATACLPSARVQPSPP